MTYKRLRRLGYPAHRAGGRDRNAVRFPLNCLVLRPSWRECGRVANDARQGITWWPKSASMNLVPNSGWGSAGINRYVAWEEEYLQERS